MQAPEIVSVHATFTSHCLDTVTISFATNTSTPVVEVPTKLDTLLSFDAPELQTTAKFGVWFDLSTLVVVFRECAKLGSEESAERPLHLMFEAERGTPFHYINRRISTFMLYSCTPSGLCEKLCI